MMRESPWEEPSACGGTKRSMPSTCALRRASCHAAALPAAPSPTTIASKDARGTSLAVAVAAGRRLDARARREPAPDEVLDRVARDQDQQHDHDRDRDQLDLARAACHAERG